MWEFLKAISAPGALLTSLIALGIVILRARVTDAEAKLLQSQAGGQEATTTEQISQTAVAQMNVAIRRAEVAEAAADKASKRLREVTAEHEKATARIEKLVDEGREMLEQARRHSAWDEDTRAKAEAARLPLREMPPIFAQG